MAPRAARRDLYIAATAGGPPPSSLEGPLASGVPGSVAGLALAHRRAGRLPWKAVVEPAVRLARDGFVMTEAVSESIAGEQKRLAADLPTARIFLPGGAPPAPGTLFRQPELARTLEAIRDRGEDGFYRGRVARAIADGQKRAGGLITRGDLARYAGEGPQARALPLPGRRHRDDAGALLRPRPRRDGAHGGDRRPRPDPAGRTRVRALARRDREARVPRPQPAGWATRPSRGSTRRSSPTRRA